MGWAKISVDTFSAEETIHKAGIRNVITSRTIRIVRSISPIWRNIFLRLGLRRTAWALVAIDRLLKQ
jgi:hypothetical protein